MRPYVDEIVDKVDALGDLDGDAYFIREAVREACIAALEGNYGVGAVIVHNGKIVARGRNELGNTSNPMFHVAHAEIKALEDYHIKVDHNDRNPEEVCVYTTLEPCPMCTCAIFNAGVKKVLAGSVDEWGGQMISNQGNLVSVWRSLLTSSGTSHKVADVPAVLGQASRDIFMLTKESLDRALSTKGAVNSK